MKRLSSAYLVEKALSGESFLMSIKMLSRKKFRNNGRQDATHKGAVDLRIEFIVEGAVTIGKASDNKIVFDTCVRRDAIKEDHNFVISQANFFERTGEWVIVKKKISFIFVFDFLGFSLVNE